MRRAGTAGVGVAGLALGLTVAALAPGRGGKPVDAGRPHCVDCTRRHVVEPEPEPLTATERAARTHGAFAVLTIPDAGHRSPGSGWMTVDVAGDGRTAVDATGTGGVVLLVGAAPGRHTYRVRAPGDSGPLGPQLDPGTYLVLAEIDPPPLPTDDDEGPPPKPGTGPHAYPAGP